MIGWRKLNEIAGRFLLLILATYPAGTAHAKTNRRSWAFPGTWLNLIIYSVYLGFFWFALASAWALDPNLPPGSNFDLSTWTLQLPINASGELAGASYEIPNGDLTSVAYTNPASPSYCNGQVTNYFYTGSDGAMTFWATDQGATTPSSSHARSELSQLSRTWFLRGAHKLSVQCKVLQTNTDTGTVCIGQIKGFSPNMTCVMFFYDNGLLQARIHTKADESATVYYNYGTVGLGNAFNYTLQAVDGLVTVAANGVTNSVNLLQSDPGYATNSLYFKAGAYNQSAFPSTNDGSRVAFYSLAVFNGPNITNQPVSQAVNQGDNATFSVAASGNGTKRYQWGFNATNSLSEKTSASLTVSNVSSASVGDYTVVVSDSYGSVTSSVARLTTNAAPKITSQPANQSVWSGDTATFTVGIFGNAPLTYRWFFNSTNAIGANTNVFMLTNAQSVDAGKYSVVVTNAFGAITSSVATLTFIVSDTNVFTASGTWTCPANVFSVQVECWGGGGAGGSALRTPDVSSVQYGGGGAGGAYARLNAYPVTPGGIYYINVGAGGANNSTVNDTRVSGGDSWLNSDSSPSTVIIAKGGQGGESAVGNTSTTRYGLGGAGTMDGSAGDIVYSGGSGATGAASVAGGGGSSAGTDSNGTSATSNVGATAQGGGGDGGTGPTTSSANGGDGFVPGGGGSGARASGTQRAGGTGGAGKVVLTYTANAPFASFAASPSNGVAPLTVTFTDTSTGTITNRFWSFGDGVTTNTTVTRLLHTYQFPGTYNVRLIVSGDNGSATNTQINCIVANHLDTVGDGIPDWWRAQFFGGNGDTTNAYSCATSDFDRDGFDNLAEYLSDTDPTNAASRLEFISLAIIGKDVRLVWAGGSNAWQCLQYCSDLTNTNVWITVYTNTPPTSITNTLLDIDAKNRSSRFYRITAGR